MKKTLFSAFVLIFISIQYSFGQNSLPVYSYPPTHFSDGVTFLCSRPINDVINHAEMIFEGRVLTDSIYIDKPYTYKYLRVLVLKEFKGNFPSDTITVATGGGGANALDGYFIDGYLYGKKGDEAMFLMRSYGNIQHDLYGNGCGYITICDKKDIDKNIYEPLETALGHKYVEVHPNNCATQKTK